MKIITTEKKPIKLWLKDIEDGALQQAKNLANLPFIHSHIAIMPDSHQGYGMPIGGVMATKGVVVPNAVGVDIGCGMCAVKTSLTEIDTDTLKRIMGEIRKVVPVGFKKHKKKQDATLMPKYQKKGGFETSQIYKIADTEHANARCSLGTLGGGNHFIEIQKGNDGYIWIMIHSGSRNLGLQVAHHYGKLAYDLNKKWHSNTYLPKNWKDSLAFLPLDSKEGKMYLREMQYCVNFALANRKLMMDRVMKIFGELNLISQKESMVSYKLEMINIAHNYAKMENHFGKNVMIHRKGATLASKDTIGIIPSSQGTKSYIVKGLGNPQSFNSCSHGAGRKMARGRATRELNLEEELKRMEGIVHGMRNKSDLDEAVGSYKDMDTVMENQKDLVEKLVELSPLAVLKG